MIRGVLLKRRAAFLRRIKFRQFSTHISKTQMISWEPNDNTFITEVNN